MGSSPCRLKASRWRVEARALYGAACCQALANKPQLALETLDLANNAGLTDATQLKNDADFASISKTPRFAALVAKIEKRDAAFETATEPKLRKEILEMIELDQAARREAIELPPA